MANNNVKRVEELSNQKSFDSTRKIISMDKLLDGKKFNLKVIDDKFDIFLTGLLDECDGNFLFFDDSKFIHIIDNYINLDEFICNDETISITHESTLPNDKNSFDMLAKDIDSENRLFYMENNFSNIYLTYGFIKYEDYFAPLFFIPINFTYAQNEIRISRNINLNVLFNLCIKEELYDVSFPKYDGDILSYVEKLGEIDGIDVFDTVYIGNFDQKMTNILTRLNNLNFDNSVEDVRSLLNETFKYSSNEIKKLINIILVKWPDLGEFLGDNSLGDIIALIMNYLYEGNSVLLVEDSESQNKFKNKFSCLLDNDLIFDIKDFLAENKINADSFRVSSVNNNLNGNDNFDEIFLALENACDALEIKYSAMELLPVQIKRRKDEYFKRIGFINYEFPIKNAHTLTGNYVKNLKNEIIDMDVNLDLIKYNEKIPSSFFESSEYRILNNVIETVNNNLNSFIEINKELSDIYGIKKFDRLDSVKYLKNLSILNNNYKYVDLEDRIILNEVLLNNDEIGVYNLENICQQYASYKSILIDYNKTANEIWGLFDNFGIDHAALNEYMNHISLLRCCPVLIENEKELENCVELLVEYINNKNFKGPSIGYLNEFIENNPKIRDILDSYVSSVTKNIGYLEFKDDLDNIVSLFGDIGFNFNTFEDYLRLKDRLSNFENANLIKNNKYIDLIGYISEFKDIESKSIKEYFENFLTKCHEELILILENNYSNDIYNITRNLISIKRLLDEMEIKFTNLNQIQENREILVNLNTNYFKYDYVSEKFLDSLRYVLDNFEIDTNLKDEFDKKFNEVKQILYILNDASEEYFKDNFYYEYIKLDIIQIKSLLDKMGLNSSNLIYLKDNESIFDILSGINVNVGVDMVLYGELFKLQNKWNASNLYELKDKLENNLNLSKTIIKNQFGDILEKKNDFKDVKNRIIDLKNILSKIYDKFKVMEISKISELDSFIENFSVLKNHPTFLEDSSELSKCVNLLEILKQRPNIDEEDLRNYKLKLDQIKNYNLLDKISKFKIILEGCDKYLDISDITYKFETFMNDISKLDIDLGISKYDLGEVIKQIEERDRNFSYYSQEDKKRGESSKNKKELKIKSLYDEYQFNLLIEFPKELDKSSFTCVVPRNYNINRDLNSFNEFIVFKDKNPVYNFIKNKNISNSKLIKELTILKELTGIFNSICELLSNKIKSNLNEIARFNLNQELYKSCAEPKLLKYCPNSFNGLQSDVDELRNEIKYNNFYSKLVNEGFFTVNISDFNVDELDSYVDNIIGLKTYFEKILTKNPYVNDDITFNDLENYLENIIENIENSKDISIENLINSDLSNLIDGTNIDQYNEIYQDYNMIKDVNLDFNESLLRDIINSKKELDNLISKDIFTDNTLNYLDENSHDEINKDIYDLKIKINSVYSSLKFKNFDFKKIYLLDDVLDVVNNELNNLLNLKYKNDELLFLSDTNSYNLINKLDLFIKEYGSQIKFNQSEFEQILEDVSILNSIYNYDGENIDKFEIFNYSSEELSEFHNELKNNLTYLDLLNQDIIKQSFKNDGANKLLELVDNTLEISENIHSENLEELINKNTPIIDQYDEIKQYIEIIKETLFNENVNEYANVINGLADVSTELSSGLRNEFSVVCQKSTYLDKLINFSGIDLNINLIEFPHDDILKLIESFDLNMEFTGLINSGTFNQDKISEFYNNPDFKLRLGGLNELISKITKNLSKDYLNMKISDLQEKYESNDFYSRIRQAKNLFDSGNVFQLMGELSTLIKDYPIDKKYLSEISNIEEKLKNIEYLCKLEDQLDVNLIIKHFKDNDDKFNIDLLDSSYVKHKFNIDKEFTELYGNSVFTDKTIEAIKSKELNQLIIPEFNSLTEIKELYHENDLEINKTYENNVNLILQIEKFDSSLINEIEFLRGINEVLNNETIVEYINQGVSYAESSLKTMKDKYDLNNSNYVESINNNIKYTELIDNNIFEDENLIKNNLSNVMSDCDVLYQIYQYLAKQLFYIYNFYLNNTLLGADENSFKLTNSIEDIRESISNFKSEWTKIKQSKNYKVSLSKNSLVNEFIKQCQLNDIDKALWGDVFLYNIYNSILNTFLEKNNFIKEEHIDSSYYSEKYEEAYKISKRNNIKHLFASVYSNLVRLNESDVVLNQNNLFNSKISNENANIRELLVLCKDYIMANKPIFLMNIVSVSEFLDESFEKSFDHVIVTNADHLEGWEYIALILLSKNKLIIME